MLFRVRDVLESDWNRTGHAAYLTYGMLTGIAIFLWTMLAIFLARFFRAPAAVQSKLAA